jgi:hypothetical protein
MEVKIVQKNGKWLVEDRPFVKEVTLITPDGVKFKFALVNKIKKWETCFMVVPETGMIFDAGKDLNDTITRAQNRISSFLGKHWTAFFEQQAKDVAGL